MHVKISFSYQAKPDMENAVITTRKLFSTRNKALPRGSVYFLD